MKQGWLESLNSPALQLCPPAVETAASLLDDYPGAKGGSGVWQRIISEIPPHDVFIECFAGSATISRLKRLAQSTILIDDCPAVATALEQWAEPVCGAEVIRADAVEWLAERNATCEWSGFEVVYADPPYLMETRSTKRPLYKREFGTVAEHRRLLETLLDVPVPVLLSGYPSKLYAEMLSGWRCLEYTTGTHGGARRECLWCSFPPPMALHDARFIGSDFTDRQRLKRKAERWKRNLLAMPRLDRIAVFDSIRGILKPDVSMGSHTDAGDLEGPQKRGCL